MKRHVPERIKKKFAWRVSPFYGVRRALIGAVINGERQIAVPGRDGWVYIRFIDPSEVAVAQAINLASNWTWDAPVRVRAGLTGQLEVFEVDYGTAVNALGRGGAALTVPNLVLTGLVDERRFEPLLVQARRVQGSFTLSVYINSGWYRARGTARHFAGGWLDLSAYVPDESERRLVLVGINVMTNTPVAVPAEPVGVAVTFSEADIENLLTQIDKDILPLAAIDLKHGDVAISSEQQIIDARAFLTLGGDSAGGGTVLPGAGEWNPDLSPVYPHGLDDEFDDASLGSGWTEYDPDAVLGFGEGDGVLTITLTGDVETAGPVGLWCEAPAGDFQVVTKMRISELISQGYLFFNLELGFPTPGYRARVQLMVSHFISAGWRHTIFIGWRAPESVGPFEQLGGGTGPRLNDWNDWCYLRVRYEDDSKTFAGEYSLDGINWLIYSTLTLENFEESPDKIWLSIDGALYDDPEGAIEVEFFRVRPVFGNLSDPVHGRNEDVYTEAANVTYAPAEPADWPSGVPATIQEALDILAARLRAIE